MSARDPFGSDPEDLGVRARRGLLSRAEQRELERATEASATLRIAYEVGRDMDGMTAVRGGDDALIADAASTALARASGGSPRVSEVRELRGRRGRRLIGAAAVALAILSASGMAAALWSGMVSWPFGSTASEPSAPAPRALPRPHARRSPALQPGAGAQPSAAVASAEPASVTGVPGVPRARRNGAAELFHAANAARRSGDFARAARLYAELRAVYPDTDEGGLACVSLGQLLLARGEAAAAEREFRRYLARGRGQLVEEALVGQAHSLQRMGRTRGERESLQRLITDHPDSVYAAQARLRLAALDSNAAPPAR